MKIKKSYKLQAAAVLATALCCASCSDTWDDHYSEASNGIINTTLWEAISSNAELTNFAKVIKGCGYDATLDGSQTFTVFAPTNACLTEEQADSLVNRFNEEKASGVKAAENSVIRQFVMNHIALYKKSIAESTVSDSLTMMNGKYQTLTATSVGGNLFESKNVLYNNGILNTIDGKMAYEPNIFEYMAQDNELDSIYNFLKSYNMYKFNADASVPGSIIDGKTQYLDSVMVSTNALFSLYGYINSEDSTYWMLAPTNSEWKRMVEEYTPYFTYDVTVDKYDSLQYAHTRQAIIMASIFSRTNNKDAAFRDSAISTSANPELYYQYYPEEKRYNRFYKPFDAGGIFEGTQEVALSNGHLLKASDFRISPFETFLQESVVKADYSSYLDTLSNAIDPMTVRTVLANNPFYNKLTENKFVEIQPEAVGAQPSVTFLIPNVLSNVPYDIYAVFVPALAYDTLATEEQRLPVKFRAQVGYQQNGSTKWERNSSFTTKPDVIDTIKIKNNYQFKTTAYGLDKYQAKVKLYTDVTSSQTSQYQTTMRIDCIIVKPHNAPVSEAKRYKIAY